MNKIRHATLGLALLAMLASGGIVAAAKEGGSAKRSRVISGIVTRVDINARTVEIREVESQRTIAVQIPYGSTVETNLASEKAVSLERLLPGMLIRAAVR